MIRLSPAPRPAELTDEVAKELTEIFMATNERVWNKDFIKKALSDMSFGKCCYCECRIDEESKYLEVEHFFPKSIYKDKVLEWENLLPACKRCNGIKSEHDPALEPIVHPVYDDPKAHLAFKAYRFYGKTSSGKTHIEVVELNARDRLQRKRYEIGAETKEKLDELEIQLKAYLEEPPSAQKKRRMLSKLEGIMTLGQPNQEYSATVATEILREDSYHFAKQTLLELNLWGEVFQRLEDGLKRIAFVE